MLCRNSRIKDAGDLLQINYSTAKTIISQYRENGELPEKQRGGHKAPKIDEDMLQQIEELVENNPTITLCGINERLASVYSVDVGKSTIHNVLRSS